MAAPTPSDRPDPNVVIIGAGPAGLTAAYELTKHGNVSTILEGTDQVGGISRTVERDGWRFDIGGHRFFTKVKEVEALWHEILPPDDFLLRPRMSRIFYRGKYYDYPIRAANALKNLGPIEAVRCVLSYLYAQIRPPKNQDKFEGWVTARFGKRLYQHFFKSYTEKVWGMPADELPSDWAAQRIKNLDLKAAVLDALLPKRNQKEITSLIQEFQYPKYGPGMMWEVCRDKVVAQGCTLHMETKVRKIRHRDGRAYEVVAVHPDGTEETFPCDEVISSMPFTKLVKGMDPAPPPEVIAAADEITYRDFLSVALVVPEEFAFPDNWIYIHSPEVEVGRIQNYGSWSPYMVKEGRTCLGLEYFVFEGDEMWNKSDDDLIEQAKREIAFLGLVDPSRVELGHVVRVPKAYPTYDEGYADRVETLRKWIDTNTPNVHPVGRNGMHRYNNQDHSMFTAMLTVENIVEGTNHDVWSVNVEEEYHEESATSGESGRLGTGRDAPVLPRKSA
ncbi:MAG TPA: NAD(P)/FAD-dependent oxidoreductase [Acidimicrobiales bacterium]|nr:NAD(P)/FAD-dependent oxidoreductase [Acidimicrobiales bacterium]